MKFEGTFKLLFPSPELRQDELSTLPFLALELPSLYPPFKELQSQVNFFILASHQKFIPSYLLPRFKGNS